MPKHYAVGKNVQTGSVHFDNVKTVVVNFEAPFQKRPNITLTLSDNNNTPPYKTQANTTQFKIKFKTAFMGDVDWQAMERS